MILSNNQIPLYVVNANELEAALRNVITGVIKDYEEKKSESFVTIVQAMQRLGVSRATLWRWKESNYLTPVKIGRKVVYKESDIRRMEVGDGR